MSTMIPTSGPELAASVPMREYQRLLGLPRGHDMEGDLLARAQSAQRWYAVHGRPFAASERVELEACETDCVLLKNGTKLLSPLLARRLDSGQAHGLMILAVSAGTEVADEIARHWAEGRPDEAFFLDRFAVAVTEHLVFWASGNLCRSSSQGRSETLLPHLSPGCGNWDLADQNKLMAILAGGSTRLGPLELLSSGALHPQHSYLTAMGITHRNFAASPNDLCRSCDLTPCAFRRVPFNASSPFAMGRSGGGS